MRAEMKHTFPLKKESCQKPGPSRAVAHLLDAVTLTFNRIDGRYEQSLCSFESTMFHRLPIVLTCETSS